MQGNRSVHTACYAMNILKIINFFFFLRVVKRKDKKRLMCFEGRFTLSISLAKEGTFYKYAVIKKGDVHYEYLTEFQPRYRGGIVDRFLRIPEKYVKPGGKLTKLAFVVPLCSMKSPLPL